MLKGIVSKSVCLISLISIILSVIMPFNIHAEETVQTYDLVPANTCVMPFLRDNNYRRYVAASVDTRSIAIQNQSNIYFFLVADESFTVAQYNGTSNSGCPVTYTTDNIVTYNNYYMWRTSFMPLNNVEVNFPIVYDNNITSSNQNYYAYYYTYGDGAVGPEVGPTYGQLKIGFTTSIAYSGGNSNAWRDNKDTIYFDRYDTLGNDLKGLNIELQAVPYTTEASSKQNLLGQRANEFIYDTVRVGSLGFYSPGQNPIDFTWEYITNRFSPTWFATYGDNWSLTGWYLSDHWYKVGWCYRARVVDDEMNTIIDWQTIYNGTSIDAQDTDNIINNNGYNPDLVNSINEINNFNNTTNNNYYNNQVINYNDGNLTSDGSWIEEFIRGIFETLGDIINAISGIGSSIIKGIFDLISNLGVNILDTFTNLWNGFINLFNGVNFTDDNPEFDLDLGVEEGDSPLDIIPAFVRMMNSSGLGYMLWLPLVVGIIFMVL